MPEEILELSADEKTKVLVSAYREDDSIILRSVPETSSKYHRKQNSRKSVFELHMFDNDKINQMLEHRPVYENLEKDSFVYILTMKLRKIFLSY